MDQLEDDLHRVLQLARAQSQLSRHEKTGSNRSKQQTSSHQHRQVVHRHRHRKGESRESRARPPATLLDAKLKGISAIYGLKSTISKLSDCSTRAMQVHLETARIPSKDDQDPEEQERALEAKLVARRDLYRRHFSGLRAAYGPSGLPKLECLLDAAQDAKAKMARHSALAVGASVLTSANRIYASCTIESIHDAKFTICAERAALLKALGEDPGEVVVAMAICSDIIEVLPSPCGSCREFMAEFGDFPVYLMNANFESEETRSFTLFPRARQSSTSKVLQQQKKQHMHAKQHSQNEANSGTSDCPRPSISKEDPELQQSIESLPMNVRDWTSEHVLCWLRDDVELPQYRSIFKRSAVDGCTLLHLEDCDLQLLFGILQPLHRRRILVHIDRLKDRELLEHGIDYGQLQDYLAILDQDRITIVAELKATFDRLDQNKDGFLDFREVRQALSALHCNASPQVIEALLRGKLLGGNGEGKVSFSNFAAAFSSLAMQPPTDAKGGQPEAETVWQLPALDIHKLQSTYNKVDKNKSGDISEQELAQLFQGLDSDKSKDECARKAREWFAAADSDGDGRLSFAEFLIRYIQLKQVDILKLKSFFESCEPVGSTKLKPVGVLKRALETFFVDFSAAEISVWYKRHLNSELLRVMKADATNCSDQQEAGDSVESQSDGHVSASEPTRTSLTISYPDFILAVFLFRDHVKDRRQQTHELRAKMSNDALVHKSRVVHLQQSGHVRLCPQTKEVASAATAAEDKSLLLADIRRNQLKQRLRTLQSQQQGQESEDEAKATSDRENDSIAATAKRQKRHLARLLAKVDVTFDRFGRGKGAKKWIAANSSTTKGPAGPRRNNNDDNKRSATYDTDEDEKKCDSSDSDSPETGRAGYEDDGELNAIEVAQAMTELGISCPRERILRLLKDEGFGIHDRVDRHDFRRLFLHFHTQNESTLGRFPSHRRPMSSSIRIWDEEVEHAKRMQEMAALLSGTYGKHPNRQDYDHYLMRQRGKTGHTESGSRNLRDVSIERKSWTKELARVQSKKRAEKHSRSDNRSRRSPRRRRAEREETKGDSSDSNTSSADDDDSKEHRREQRGQHRGRQDRRHISRSRSRAPRSHRSTRAAGKRSHSQRRHHRSSSSHSTSSSSSSNKTTECEREELVRERRRLQYVEQRRKGFEIGDRVMSTDDGYGTLIRLYQDYFVADVHFDSGKKVKNVDLAKIERANPLDELAALRRHQQRARNFHAGMRVLVSYKGTRSTRKGKITVCRLDGTFDVFVDQLGAQETLKRVPAKHLCALPSKPTVYTVGASVTVKQAHAYLRGKVQLCRVDGSYDICLRQDRSMLKHVEVDLIFPDNDDDDDPGEDDRGNEANSRDSRAMAKKSTSSKKRAVTSDSEDEKKKDDDHDGYDDFEPEFANGDRIEARFQGKGAYYPGKISRVLTDGTYDIVYDDGDSETRVKSHLIRPFKSASSSSQPKTTRVAENDDYEDDFE